MEGVLGRGGAAMATVACRCGEVVVRFSTEKPVHGWECCCVDWYGRRRRGRAALCVRLASGRCSVRHRTDGRRRQTKRPFYFHEGRRSAGPSSSD